MSLNTTQKIAMVAVVGGLVTIPVVYASRNSTPNTEDQATIQNLRHLNTVQPPKNGIIDTNNGRITQSQNFDKIQDISNTTTDNNALAEGPAARQNRNQYSNQLQSRDIPANEQYNQAQYSQNDMAVGQMVANTPNNFDNSAPTGAKDCQYSQAAFRSTGVKHYRFTQANEATLVNIGGGYKLAPEAAAALRKLQSAAKADGVTLTVGSAFRSVSYQQGIVSRKKAAGQSDAQIYKVSSAPGYSEHHTGYALDFSPINNSFAKTKGYSWLRQHGNEYGWEQSFTPQSTRDTKVAVESWHWKYKGSPTAVAALANDGCY